jgi:hypothetical protein
MMAALQACSESKMSNVQQKPEHTIQTHVNKLVDEHFVEPEVVQIDEVRVRGDVKTIKMENALGHYLLSCNVDQKSCITPEPSTDYWVYKKDTRWLIPGASTVSTLQFFQDWSGTYPGENIALFPKAGKGEFGMYWLDVWSK